MSRTNTPPLASHDISGARAPKRSLGASCVRQEVPHFDVKAASVPAAVTPLGSKSGWQMFESRRTLMGKPAQSSGGDMTTRCWHFKDSWREQDYQRKVRR